MPKLKIIGGYRYKGKNDNVLIKMSCVEERLSCVGICTLNVKVQEKDLPKPFEDMINKTYFIDVRESQYGSFANGFCELKEGK